MIIYFHKKFTKQIKKLAVADRDILRKRLELFIDDPFHVIFRNHALKGKYNGYRSIDIKPDLRAIYKEININEARFVLLGSHGQLYK